MSYHSNAHILQLDLDPSYDIADVAYIEPGVRLPAGEGPGRLSALGIDVHRRGDGVKIATTGLVGHELSIPATAPDTLLFLGYRFRLIDPNTGGVISLQYVGTLPWVEAVWIDWGDGSALEQYTGTSPYHTYAAPGDYTITITVQFENTLDSDVLMREPVALSTTKTLTF